VVALRTAKTIEAAVGVASDSIRAARAGQENLAICETMGNGGKNGFGLVAGRGICWRRVHGRSDDRLDAHVRRSAGAVDGKRSGPQRNALVAED